VRQHRIGRGSDPSSEIEDVHVDLARTVCERRPASDFELDALGQPKQRARRAAPSQSGGDVPEEGLVAVTDGLGPVEGGDGEQGGAP
jgi:hypothetical protein